MAWQRHANPFAGVSQLPMRMLYSLSPIELANCVPIVRITKIDSRGRPDTSVRPLMYDLVQTPQYGATGGFGTEAKFAERALVSLNSLRLEYRQQYGPMMFRDVTLEFTVHKPEVVFNRAENIPWRQIMVRGGLFSLEYGWTADPSVVKNGLFNGIGIVTPEGLVVRSTQTVLLNVHWCEYRIGPSGEVTVTVQAFENGDIALRQSKISDVMEEVRALEAIRRLPRPADRDRSAVAEAKRRDQRASTDVINSLLASITPIVEKNRKTYVRLGDVLDRMVDPLVRASVANFGYVGVGPEGPVSLLLGDFNPRAGRQSREYGGGSMAGLDIGEFKIPFDVLRDRISKFFAIGRHFYLYDFIVMLINGVNATAGWAQPRPDEAVEKPELILKSDTLPNGDGTSRLVMVIYDRKIVSRAADQISRIPLEKQTRENIMRKLSEANIPVIEFGRAGSLILDASFQIQPNPALQSIQIDQAYSDQKDRVQQNLMPDVDGRQGAARDGDLVVPASILEGQITMLGNFASDVFTLVWIEFFGASEISGFFSINGKTDTIEPGRFISEFKFISEGIDPLNTRRRMTEREFDEQERAARELKEKAAAAAAKKPRR